MRAYITSRDIHIKHCRMQQSFLKIWLLFVSALHRFIYSIGKKKEFYQKLEQQCGKLLYLLLYYKQALSCQL